MKYEFLNRKDESHSAGYDTVTISNGQASIDEKNKDQVALAEKLGGIPSKKREETVIHKALPKKTAQKRESE